MGTAHKRTVTKQATQNRELSWLQFNRRVQYEADNPDNPLLERAKFLGIVSSNLDEFIQVRYERIYDAAGGEFANEQVYGEITAKQLYRKVNKDILRLYNMSYLLYEGIRSELYMEDVQLFPVFQLDSGHMEREKDIFMSDIHPYLKIESIEESQPKQKQLYLCVKLEKPSRKQARFVTIAMPPSLPRLFNLSSRNDISCLIRLEDVVCHCLGELFPKEVVSHAAVFRVIRNQNFLVEERTIEDVVPAIRDMLGKRITGHVVRLEAEERMSEEMLTLLMERFDVSHERRYRVTGPLDLNKMMMTLYAQVKRPDLKYQGVKPVLLDELMGDDVLDVIERKDYLLYHPYHSFEPVVHLMQCAAVDPEVRAIKQTLYRVSGNSPIIASLVEAAQNGKRVTVLMEAHARFDEENNLYWGQRLQRAGCTVMYGLPNLKVHSKITYFEREVNGEIKRAVHLGTGNYHDGTAKLYTDFGLLTANEQLTGDAYRFFERLEGKADAEPMGGIISAPHDLQPTLQRLIEREKQNALAGKRGYILAKMNGLSDRKMIESLLDASCAGVKIDLIVRGICCLIPGKLGVSENIRVYSIVGRNLEHARAFVFANDGEREVYLSSADWMPRNLYRRVELMFPILDERCSQAVYNVLALQLRDTAKCRVRRADTSYVRKQRTRKKINAQEELLQDVEGIFRGDGYERSNALKSGCAYKSGCDYQSGNATTAAVEDDRKAVTV
ncbi:MAG: polyphosphate kinase 1 [Clostridiales bacterium]|nr:polyphosphate kinase 1 [Clostridiales bacterium]